MIIKMQIKSVMYDFKLNICKLSGMKKQNKRKNE